MSDELTPASDGPSGSLRASTTAEDQAELVETEPKFSVMSIESVLFDLSDSSPLVHLIEEARTGTWPSRSP